MQLEEILLKLRSDHGFVRRRVDCTTSKAILRAAPEIEALVAEWSGASGWIARQSGVIFFPGADDRSLGAVLEAELGSTEASLQIRRLDGGWVWTKFNERAGTEMLADDVVVATTHGKAARYRRYWTLPDSGAAEVRFCRLVGLEDIA